MTCQMVGKQDAPSTPTSFMLRIVAQLDTEMEICVFTLSIYFLACHCFTFCCFLILVLNIFHCLPQLQCKVRTVFKHRCNHKFTKLEGNII